MKLILAIIKPFKLDAVREALTAAGIEVRRQLKASVAVRPNRNYRGAEYEINFCPKCVWKL